ncbi:FtsX-like permease family protein [Clostridium sp. UBA6640]|uniref:FtsX-like permease family protein n=1 Tax=Clostridium sp. UBA6640 TaxID=1946370 RepID=UPI0025B85CFF|nr:ABC transporter permease [Clostridium sp. UBA6640]
MNSFKMALKNFKNNIRVYYIHLIAMTISVAILFNFQSLRYGETIKSFDKVAEGYCSIMLKTITIMLIVFLGFFIWFSTNIFLKQRKKEIGIYAFMGIDNYQIGKIFFFETLLLGLFSILLGIVIGIFSTKLFQMIVIKASGFQTESNFDITFESIGSTILIFLVIFLIMSLKGFINIARCKLIDLFNAARKEDKMPKIGVLIYIIAIISIIIIVLGYRNAYLAADNFNKTLTALILIILGTYGLLGAALPVVLKHLIKRKSFFYKGVNVISISNIAYRIRTNYKTYATVVILAAATITALGTAITMNHTYKNRMKNKYLYTFSYASTKDINEKSIKNAIEKSNHKITKEVKLNLLYSDNIDGYNKYGFISFVKYSDFIRALKELGNYELVNSMNSNLTEENRCIYVQKAGTLATLSLGEKTGEFIVDNKQFLVSEKIKIPFLGGIYPSDLLIINDRKYSELEGKLKKINFYGIRVDNEENTKVLTKELESMVDKDRNNSMHYFYLDKKDSDSWVKFVYVIGCFLAIVFAVATGSIVYFKIFDDANNDKEKYKILIKLGIDDNDIAASVNKQISIFFILTLTLGILHSIFAIRILSKMLFEDLTKTFIITVLIFIIIYLIFFTIAKRNFIRVIKEE